MEDKNYLEAFFLNRDSLIDKYEKGNITKTEYVCECMKFFKDNNLEPYDHITTIEQGMFNYQYYNMLAKYYYIEAHECELKGEEKYMQSFLDEAYECYKIKDKATFEIIKIVNLKNVEAYYIKLSSESLSGKLFEIKICNYDRAVFHSKNYKIRDYLKRNGVFKKEAQKSIIDSYVNDKY